MQPDGENEWAVARPGSATADETPPAMFLGGLVAYLISKVGWIALSSCYLLTTQISSAFACRGRCGTDAHAHYLINPSGADRATCTSLACRRPSLRKNLASQLVHRCVWHVVWVSTGHPVPTVLARMHYYRALDHYMQPDGGNEWAVYLDYTYYINVLEDAYGC